MRRTALAVVGLGIAALVGGMLPASADIAHDRVVSANPDDWVPIVEDGQAAWGTATVGSTTVVGGSFTSVLERGASSPVVRNNIFAFDSNGRISETFVPDLGTGQSNVRVWDIIPAGDGVSVYVGGNFLNVDGLPRTARVARINVNTGEVMTTFRSPGFNGPVMDLHLANGKLYAGGYFTVVRGQPRTALVALDPVTGADTGTVDITFADLFRDTTRSGISSGLSGVGIERFTMTPDGSRLVSIGNYRTVDGQPRPQVAVIDTSGPTATLSDWATDRYGMTCSASFPTYTLGLDVSPDGKYFVVSTGGAFNGGVSSGTLCDTVARWELDSTGAGQQPTWVNYLGGDTGTAVDITGSVVYLGGHFRWVNNPYAGDRVGPGTVHRKGLAALDPRNGLPLSWNPTRNELGFGVGRFYATPQGLWTMHDGDSLGREVTGKVGLFPLASGEVLPADDTGSLPGDAFVLGNQRGQQPPAEVSGDDVFSVALTANGASGVSDVPNGGVDWSSVRGAFMVDDRLYTAWADGTFTWRAFRGTWFGGERPIDLLGLTAFASDLAGVRGMWFDSTLGRMYYTLEGVNKLYYRYFTPESQTVGAVRFEQQTNGSVDWGKVAGGFLANDSLYFSSMDGSLRSVPWQDGGVVGDAQPALSGPDVDGIDWSPGALVLRP